MRVGLLVPVLLFGGGLLAQSPSKCSRPELAGQTKDAATVVRLEREWSAAFMRGDTDFEACLLLPEYQEITSHGKVDDLSAELAHAAKNKGKNLPMPEFHAPTVLLRDDVAVAHGDVHYKDAAGKDHEMQYADFYHWENGGWRVFFAQQTSVPSGS
ncbi:MAG TPA: nuclear transport factor 2 family protein [Candidatus Koribacter sp.]|jgi:hypothetical protein